MLKYFLQKQFNNFGKKFNYDVSYITEMTEFYPAKAWRYALISPMGSHFSAVPKELYFAVKITATKLADCGTCTELTLKMAVSAGIDRQQIGHLIMSDVQHMRGDILLGYQYAMAVEQNSLDLLEIIEHIKVEYGKKGLWDVASAFNFGEYYPKLKRGLGEAISCRPPLEMVKDLLNG